MVVRFTVPPLGELVAHSPRVSNFEHYGIPGKLDSVFVDDADENKSPGAQSSVPGKLEGVFVDDAPENKSLGYQDTGSPGKLEAVFVYDAPEDKHPGAQETTRGTARNTGKEDIPAFPLTIDDSFRHLDIPLHVVSWKDESHPQWVRIRTVMDSGAAESVAPPSMVPGVIVQESPGSKRGQHYVSASAGRLPNLGQQQLSVQTNEGKDSTVVYQIAEVSRPLTAVSKTSDHGNWVVYTPQGGFIINCQTGNRTHFERRGGIYELDLWVKEEDLKEGSQSSSFPSAGTLSSRVLEEGGVSVHLDYLPSQKEPADACVIPISPWVRKQCEPQKRERS